MKPAQLRPFDASFLALDGPTTGGHVCLLAVFDGPVSMSTLRERLMARMHLVPALRRKLTWLPFGIDRPWWVDDPDFDLLRHLCERTLPPSAGDADLAVEVSDIAATRLRRDRPLWEMHLLHGLPGDRTAMVTKIHHCVVDGMGTRGLLSALYGPSEKVEEESPGAWHVDPAPSRVQMLAAAARAGGDAVTSAVRLERRGLSLVTHLAGRAVSAAVGAATVNAATDDHPTAGGDRPASPLHRAPETPFNRAVSPERSAAFATIPVTASSTLRHTLGVTVNDVILAITAQGLRRWLLSAGALPDEPLVALVPVATGREVAGSTSGNHISLALCPLPTNVADPHEQLAVVHESMRLAKADPSLSESLLKDVFTFSGVSIPSALAHVATRLHLADVVRLPFNVMVSNVPSTRFPLSIGGRTMDAIYPFPPLTDGLGLMVTVEGCGTDLGLGLLTCPKLIPDVWRLRDLMTEAHDMLVDDRRS
jgi:WS/DGAT/MGAT family acyltransferase